MLSVVEKVEALGTVSIFSTLSTRDLLLVAVITTVEDLDVGEVLCEQGDEGDELYLILSGEVSIRKSEESKEAVEVAVLGAGDSLGESSLFSERPRNASLIVKNEAQILFLSRTLLHELISDYPKIAVGIIQTLVERT